MNKSVLFFLIFVSLVYPRLLLPETVDERESGPITIPAFCFQVKAYRSFGFVSFWTIEKNPHYECTKSQGRKSRENETTFESPYFSASSSYNN